MRNKILLFSQNKPDLCEEHKNCLLENRILECVVTGDICEFLTEIKKQDYLMLVLDNSNNSIPLELRLIIGMIYKTYNKNILLIGNDDNFDKGQCFLAEPNDYDKYRQIMEKVVEDEFLKGSNGFSPREVYTKVTNILASLNVSPKNMGFKYIRDICCLHVTKSQQIFPLSKFAYPYVASKYDVKLSTVERNIRQSLITATMFSNPKEIKEKFGELFSKIMESPTSANIISGICELVLNNYFI